MIREILKMIEKNGGMKAIQISFVKQIDSYDFLNNYNYAYMLNELNVD